MNKRDIARVLNTEVMKYLCRKAAIYIVENIDIVELDYEDYCDFIVDQVKIKYYEKGHVDFDHYKFVP